MTERRPLVRFGGRVRQLPVGDTIVGATGSGSIFGEPRMLATRNSASGGVVYADGQLINNALAQYPAAVADVRSANPTVPVTTPALWLSDPTLRACWAYDVANDQLRVPDYNGKQPGSINSVMFRGDGTLGFAPGRIRQDQIQNITGTAISGTNIGMLRPPANGGSTTGAFKRGATAGFTTSAGELAGSAHIDFDASGSARTGAETFPTHAIIIWGVVLFGGVTNPGAADAAALAASYANQQTQIGALDAGKRNKFVKSPEQTVASGGFLVWAHGLGVTPESIEAYYLCKTAEYGWVPGDIIRCSTRVFASTTEFGMQYAADATSVTIFMPDVLSILQKAIRGGGVAMTPARWAIIIKVERP